MTFLVLFVALLHCALLEALLPFPSPEPTSFFSPVPTPVPTYHPTSRPSTSRPSTSRPSTSRPSTSSPSTTRPSPNPSSLPPVSAPNFPSTLPPIGLGITLSPSLSTLEPTHIPTAAPTNSEKYIMFVTQMLIGITASDFNGAEVNTEAFVGAVAECFDGIHSADVSVTSTTDVTILSAVTANTADHFHLRRLQSGSVNVDYTITYNLATRGFSGDPEGGYADMMSQLMVAANTTLFNDNLAEKASNFSAVDLNGVTTGPVSFSGYEAASADDDDFTNGRSTKEMSERDKLIIGITVGVGGFLLICCLISLALWMTRKIVCCCC